ncbi:hypothetical protein OROGR_011452 [Orobanche gracilis]
MVSQLIPAVDKRNQISRERRVSDRKSKEDYGRKTQRLLKIANLTAATTSATTSVTSLATSRIADQSTS